MTEPLDAADSATVASFAMELGVLKRTRRSGWWQAGVRDPESVAEHSARVAQLAGILAALEGASPERAALLGIWHDTQEARIGDISYSGRPYLTRVPPETITADQTRDLPEPAGAMIRDVVAEYEAGQSLESRCAHDADKLECLIQAVEYRAAGHQTVQDWIESSRAALTTASAQRIADAALTVSPMHWRTWLTSS